MREKECHQDCRRDRLARHLLTRKFTVTLESSQEENIEMAQDKALVNGWGDGRWPKSITWSDHLSWSNRIVWLQSTIWAD